MHVKRRMTGALFALLVFGATPAQAQLGGLIKKAAQKAAEKKVEEKVESAMPATPLAGEPVTEATLDALLQGLSVELETRDNAKQLWTAFEARSRDLTEAERAAGNEPEVWEKARGAVEGCVENSLDRSRDQHEKEAPQKMMMLTAPGKDNTALIAKLEALGKRMTDAHAKGDIPAYTAAVADYMKMLGFDVAKDSAAAFATCGRIPPKPASVVRIERLKAEVDTLSEKRRVAEVEGEARAAKAAGMPADKYALARERLWVWNEARKRKQASRALTKEEEALFSARALDITRIESILR